MTKKVIHQQLVAEGYSNKQIAEKLGVELSYVTHLHSAYKIKSNLYPKVDNIYKLEQFIRGSLLGDGCISKPGKHQIYNNISFGHGKKQLQYLEWKNTILKELSLDGTIRKYIHKSSRYKTGECATYHLKSRQHPKFADFREFYYPDGIKIVPYDVYNIDDFGLAIWFMDDGYLHKPKNRTPVYIFATSAFSKENCEILIAMLKRNFNISASFLSSENLIRISVYSMPTAFKVLSPHVLPMFNYKLNWS